MKMTIIWLLVALYALTMEKVVGEELGVPPVYGNGMIRANSQRVNVEDAPKLLGARWPRGWQQRQIVQRRTLIFGLVAALAALAYLILRCSQMIPSAPGLESARKLAGKDRCNGEPDEVRGKMHTRNKRALA